jgi:hypothetical protein
MARPALPVESVSSYAYRKKGRVHIVMQVDGHEVPGGSVTVRLVNGTETLRRTAAVSPTENGAILKLVVPRRRLGPQAWALSIRPVEPGPFVPLQARLLAKGGQPVALLTGPRPTTKLPEPQQRRRPARLVARRAVLGLFDRGSRATQAVRQRVAR